MKPYLSIVVPLYNEEESVEKLVTKIYEEASRLECNYEIILVDDGSKDGTWTSIERLKKTTPYLRGIKLRKNFGQTAAMVAGFEHASGQVIITCFIRSFVSSSVRRRIVSAIGWSFSPAQQEVIDGILALLNSLTTPTSTLGLTILVGQESPGKAVSRLKMLFRRYLNDLHKRVPVADLPDDR